MRSLGAWRATVWAVALLAAAQAASAATLYREDFTDAEGNDGTLADVGWNGADSIASAGSSSGIFATFHWWYNNSSLASGQNPSGLSYTTENAPISLATPALSFSWAQRLERQFTDSFADASGTGNGPDVRPAIRVGGQWYAAAAAVSTGNVTSMTFAAQSTPISTAAANWLLVNDVDGTGGVTLGAAPGSALSGNITGVGLVSTFHQYQTVNFDYVEISGVPEPASWGLIAAAAIGAAAGRRRRAHA
jgi:hypothetical protein